MQPELVHPPALPRWLDRISIDEHLEWHGTRRLWNEDILSGPHFCKQQEWPLPLQPAPFDDRLTRLFFAGLLPEGQMRRLLARQLQVSGQNDFALLDRICGECAGAVTFLEPGQPFPVPGRANDVQWLNDEEVVAILDELPRRPMLAGKDGLRLSLAGAQDKLPALFDGTSIGLPLNGTPSSHILKPAIHAVPDSVLNEGFCMALAEAMQLKPAKLFV